MPKILVIGDDLTGTNATAAMYARNGLRAVTVLGPGDLSPLESDVQVVAYSTNSRHMAPIEAAHEIQQAIEHLGDPSQIVVKRFDTTLRGNIGSEMEATLRAVRKMRPHQRTVGLVVPAFPSAGRATIGGYQILDGSPILMGPAATDPFTPVHHSRVADIIHEQSALEIAEVSLDCVMGSADNLAHALRQAAERADFVVVDSVTAEHQNRISEAASELTGPQLGWVVFDTGPFGASFAQAMGLGPEHGRQAPVLALIGSPTERSRAQANRLEEDEHVSLITVATPDADVLHISDTIESRVREGFTIVGIRTTSRTPETSNPGYATRILELITGIAQECAKRLELGGIYASGGDVGVAVLKALGAQGYAIEEEVLPLAVCGAVAGGPYDGLGFATKGGLVGDEDAAVRCVRQLRERLKTTQTIYGEKGSARAIKEYDKKGL